MTEDRDFWEQIHRLLLSAVCVIEKYKLKDVPSTSELRKAGKKVIKVDVKPD
jgi:hypothetical protein